MKKKHTIKKGRYKKEKKKKKREINEDRCENELSEYNRYEDDLFGRNRQRM